MVGARLREARALRDLALDRSFFAADADRVAARLLGALLVRETRDGVRVGRVVEAEAYFGPPGGSRALRRRRDETSRRLVARGDAASHAFIGRTRRNRVMFGPPGFAYVYLVYGTSECLNVSTGADGDAQAVLVRALEPVAGVEAMRDARNGADERRVACGPGNLARALGVTRAFDGHDLTRPPLYFAKGRRRGRIARSPRVGVTKAASLPLRFFEDGNPFVSRRP